MTLEGALIKSIPFSVVIGSLIGVARLIGIVCLVGACLVGVVCRVGVCLVGACLVGAGTCDALTCDHLRIRFPPIEISLLVGNTP